MNPSTRLSAAVLVLVLGGATHAVEAGEKPAASQPTVGSSATTDPTPVTSKPAMSQPDEPRLPIGSEIPDFTLKTADGREINLKTYRGSSVTVLTFLSKNCPISKAWHKEIAAIAGEYGQQGVKFLGIMSNSTEKTPEVTAFLVKEGIKFPILDDPGNVVADRLDAIGTPHMYVIDAAGRLVYSGAINDSARDATKVKKEYFKTALASVVAGKPVAEPSPDSFIGCSIKRVVKS